MLLGLPVFHVLVLLVLLVSIALPFVQVVHARHARTLITAMMLLTLVCAVLFLLFGSHVSDRVDSVLLRCYAFSSVLCSLVDELLSARDGQAPTRFVVLVLFGIVFLLTLIILVGAMSGTF